MHGLATPEQVAEYLNIKTDTLRTWAYKKKGPPYVMVEGARRYDWSQVRAWIEERTVRHG